MTNCAKSTEGAAIYREAARLLEEAGQVSFSCEALAVAIEGTTFPTDFYKHRAVQRYLRAFSPSDEEGYNLKATALQQKFEYVHDFKPCVGRDERILALCFMAAMVEAGDA